MNKTFDAVLKYVAIAAIVGALFVPMVKVDYLFFPFITGKAFAFRTFVGIGLVAYLTLIFRDSSYLPRRNVLFWVTTLFTVVLGAATIFSENPYRSFWSNFERMEGYVTILYLYIFFIIASSVIRTKEIWYAVLSISLAASIAVGLSGFGDYSENAGASVVRIAGWLGNSTYLGIYSLIHAFIAAFLVSRLSKDYKISERPGLYLLLAAIGAFNLVVMYNTGTRGAVVGLGVSVLVWSVLVSIFEKKNAVLKKSAIGILVAALITIVSLGVTKNTEFVKNNPLLYRFASLVTTDVSSIIENQGRSRTLLWGIAKEGVAEKPLLGWGQENFSYVFGKYYDPKIYDQEQWFDRTHNVFLDWLIAGGFLGLISYLLLFVAALYIVWKSKEWSVLDKSLMTALFVAYFVHNIFVFDNLTSYILFFILLAYISQFGGNENKGTSYVTDDGITYIILVAAISLVGFVSYHTVVKPYMASRTLIEGLISFQPGADSLLGKRATTYEGRLTYFKDALAYNTFAKVEILERLVDVTPQVLTGIKDKKVIEEYMSLIDTNYQEIIKNNVGDHRAPLLYGTFLQKVGLLQESLKYIEIAEKSAPNKQSLLYQKGLVLIMMGRAPEAIEIYQHALELEPKNGEAKVYLAIAYMYNNNIAKVREILGDDTQLLSDMKLLQVAESLKKYEFIIEVAQKKIKEDPNNAQFRVSLAAVYLKMGRNYDAVDQIKKAIEIEPAFKAQGEMYIQEIQSGRNPAQ